MQQLTGLDASFLNAETGPVYGHVGNLAIYDSSDAEPLTVDRLRARLSSRLHKMPIFRKKLLEVPYNLDHPYWVDDDKFDITAHVYAVGLSAPGTRQQLNEVVARLVAKPLDRSRPLWEMAVVTGLEDGSVALVTTVHHSAIDGNAGANLLTNLLDTAADVPLVDDEPTEPWRPEREPAPWTLFAAAITANAMRPLKAAQMQWELANHFLQLPQKGLATLMRPTATLALRTSFNVKPTNRRIYVPFEVNLADVRRIKAVFGVTVNDVVMAICSGGLRTWLVGKGELPDVPLRAAVPVSIRSAAESGSGGNKVSMVAAELPTTIDDPVQRLASVSAAMTVAKDQHGALPIRTIIGLSDFAVPAIASMAARESQRMNLAGEVVPANVVISNVPGTQKPMYMAGTRMTELYPVSMLADGQALNITLNSYNGKLGFGLVGCPRAVPDLKSLADAILADLDLLAAAAAEHVSNDRKE